MRRFSTRDWTRGGGLSWGGLALLSALAGCGSSGSPSSRVASATTASVQSGQTASASAQPSAGTTGTAPAPSGVIVPTLTRTPAPATPAPATPAPATPAPALPGSTTAATLVFAPGARVTQTSGARGTELAVDPLSGHVFAAFKRGGNLWTVKSIDAGATWSNPARVNSVVGQVYAYGQYGIAVNGRGSVFLTWVDRRLGSLHVFLARSIDGGASYQSDQRVDSVSDNGFYPHLAVDVAGEVYVTYSGFDPNTSHPSPYEVWFTRLFELSPSQPLVVEAAKRVSNTPEQDDATRVVVGGANRVFVGWKTFTGDVYVSTSANGGSSFSQAVRVNDVRGEADRGFDLGARGDTVYVAWGDSRADPEGDVMFDTADASLAFGADVRVNDVTRRYQEYPEVLVSSTGLVHVFWQDHRTRGARYDIYSAASGDQGRTWTTSGRVNASTSGDQRRVSAAEGRLGKVFCGWQDDRLNQGTLQFDVFVAATP